MVKMYWRFDIVVECNKLVDTSVVINAITHALEEREIFVKFLKEKYNLPMTHNLDEPTVGKIVE